jgi:hypothetical protein
VGGGFVFADGVRAVVFADRVRFAAALRRLKDIAAPRRFKQMRPDAFGREGGSNFGGLGCAAGENPRSKLRSGIFLACETARNDGY